MQIKIYHRGKLLKEVSLKPKTFRSGLKGYFAMTGYFGDDRENQKDNFYRICTCCLLNKKGKRIKGRVK
jgi:hypothetical protein